MELIKGTGSWIGWWIVLKPEKQVLEYIRRSVPPVYKYFNRDTYTWYVNDKYIDAIRQLVSGSQDCKVEEDPWALLYLRPGAPQAIIKAVWKVLVAELHPDRGGNAEKFLKVKSAYEKLIKV